MSEQESVAARMARWARPAPQMGPAVYQVTEGELEHKHTYHSFCPWSPDGRLLLLARYNRTDPAATVCVMDTADGTCREVGRSRKWEPHTAAFQQWQGDTGRLLYMDRDRSGPVVVTCRPDGADEKRFSIAGLNSLFCAPDGRCLYAATSHDLLFPDDALAAREDKGLFRLDLETGRRELVFSIAQALALLPNADRIADCHLYAKMIIVHRRLPRVMFNFTNTLWDRTGGEPRIRELITVGLDGSNPVHVGPCVHHPNWHPLENRIVTNLHDFTKTLRFGLYPGDGRGLLEYVPATKGSGHPSFSPDGRWLCTDASGPRANRIILCDPVSGRAIVLEERDGVSAGYAAFKAIDGRAPGETVMAALQKAFAGPITQWQTQTHPAWSRDGSAILFNKDLGQGSQLYMVDVQRALERDT